MTPLIQDQQNKNVWLIGGRYVWVSSAGWQTVCTDSSCSWQNVFDTGAGHAVTALGTGLPNTSINDLTEGPGGFTYAATHGRGIWRISF